MRKSKWFVLLASLMAFSLIAAACGGDDEGDAGGGGGGAKDCTWVLGTIGALSGDFASIGQPIFQGIEYAVDEANESGDLACNIEIQSEDSQGSPDSAPPLALSLVENEQLVAVVGPYFSGETLATGASFSDAGVAFVCPSCTNETIDDQGFSTFFRAVADDAIQGEVAGEYIAALNPGSVAIIHDNQDYSKGLADNVKKALGGTAKGPFVINPEETDYSAVVAQVADESPDVVFYGGYSPQAGPLVKQLRAAGVDATFISDDGTKDSSFGELAGKGAEGVQVTCPCADPLEIPAATAFVEGINAAYDRNPGTFAADAYDAVQLVFAGLDGLNGDEDIETVRSTVVDFLRNVSGFEGITKNYTFSDTGQVEIGPDGVWIYEWSDSAGDFVALGPASELI